MGVVESPARCCCEVVVMPKLTLSFVRCNPAAVLVGFQLGHLDCVAAMMQWNESLQVVDLSRLDDLDLVDIRVPPQTRTIALPRVLHKLRKVDLSRCSLVDCERSRVLVTLLALKCHGRISEIKFPPSLRQVRPGLLRRFKAHSLHRPLALRPVGGSFEWLRRWQRGDARHHERSSHADP